jgi:uncharacterized protein DUF5343
MPDFPYISNPARLRAFLEQAQTAGVPSKVTIQFIESLGFKSKNDRNILSVLKGIGFVNTSGIPTDAWQGYRNKEKAKRVMGEALRSTYADLFRTFPDAHRKDNEALRNYFSTHTRVGEGALSCIVRTFKTLCEMADFEATRPEEAPGEELRVEKQLEAAARAPIRRSAQAGVTVNINLQLQLPATDDASIYEKLFAAMRKHLYSLDE